MREVIPKNAKLIPKDAKKVFSGQIFDVYQWQQKMFDGSFETFEMLKRADTVKIIAIKDNKIVTLEEQQPHTDVFIDVPSGRHDNPNESELEAAKRELLEETGMTFKSWRLIKVEQPHTKIDWFVYFYLATVFAGQTRQKLDAGEKINVKLVSLQEAIELTKDPRNRYLPKELFESVNSIAELIKLPKYA